MSARIPTISRGFVVREDPYYLARVCVREVDPEYLARVCVREDPEYLARVRVRVTVIHNKHGGLPGVVPRHSAAEPRPEGILQRDAERPTRPGRAGRPAGQPEEAVPVAAEQPAHTGGHCE